MTPDETMAKLSAALADRYRIEREIGRGGMATVYLAEDLKHHRRVALKLLDPGLAAAIGPERFLLEIETTAGLHHPHILPLYDSGAAGGLLFYVMPWVEGESLRDRLVREKQLPIEEALRITREVGDALSYAHSHGIIHRDIKPDNILLESGHAVVADFGIARAIHTAGGPSLTQTGVAVGTPAYTSPEQCAGARELDGRSDLYSLGCVLYEMLAGQPPFTGPTAESLVFQHLSAPPPPVTQLRPAVPAEIAAVLARALAKNPADRFKPVARFTEALARHPGLVVAPVAPRRVLRWRIALPAALLMLVGAAVVARLVGREPRIVAGATTRLTLEPGLEVDPALSPDGEMIAYAAGVPARMQIYVRRLSGGRTLALTADTTHDHRWPRWTHDGAQVAYQADSAVWLTPALGGEPRPLLRLPGPLAGFDLSPDGYRIAYALGGHVYIQDLRGGSPVAVSPAAYEVHSVAWSPDGARLAYVVGNTEFVFGTPNFGNEANSAIWVGAANGSKPIRVSDDKALNMSPAWAPDGRSLYWVSSREGTRDIFRTQLSSSLGPAGRPTRLTTGINAMGLCLDRAGTRIAYSVYVNYSSIWSIEVPRSGPTSIARALPIVSGNQTIETVDVSRDGRWLTFDSDRGGNFDVYKMPVGGGEVVQVTTDPGKDFQPRWSPDGRAIAFHSMRTDNRDIFTIAADGSDERQITRGPEEEFGAAWSADGEALVFCVSSAKGECLRILPLAGNGSPRDFAPEDMAILSSPAPRWSPRRNVICYSFLSQGLCTHDLDSGETRVLVPPSRRPSAAIWAPDGRTIYYLAAGTSPWSIESVPVEGGTPRRLVDFDDASRPHTRYGLATDGRRFYVTLGSHESDVWWMNLERR